VTTFGKRLERPRAQRLAPEYRATWRALAPQIAARSEITKLDLAALAGLCQTACHIQETETMIAAHTGRIRRRLQKLNRERRSFMWKQCREFLLGLEVLEEITMPDGRALAALIAGPKKPDPR
jgi:phage terminase small subunit